MRASKKPDSSKTPLAASTKRSRVRMAFEERWLVGFSPACGSGDAGVASRTGRLLALRIVLLGGTRICWRWNRKPSGNTLNHFGALGIEAEHARDRYGFGQRIVVGPCHIAH